MATLEQRLEAAKRLLAKGSYNHYVCNFLDDIEHCEGCIAMKKDRKLVFDE